MFREFICTPTEPIVDTKCGKYHGFKADGLYQFRGIRYAEAERFMPPRSIEPHDGIATAWAYGPTCPTNNPNSPGIQFVSDYVFWPEDENCQYLNVWTPTIDKDARKPVLVWIHGGGHEQGSPISRKCYDCSDLSENGDMVVVSLSHRLNILGYLDLTEFGKEYEDCVNVGILDIIEALRWIKENISSFGGDSSNITIMGHSGGGEKVTTLMQMEKAVGLYNRAVVFSGIYDAQPYGRKTTTAIAKAIMKELGISTIKELQQVPTMAAIDAFNRVKPTLIKEGYATYFSPIEGKNFPGRAVNVGLSEYSRKVPMMIGTVMCEFPLDNSISNKHNVSEKEKRAILAAHYGDQNIDKLITLFKEAFPDKDIADLRTYDTMFRTPTTEYADLVASESSSPVWTFLFTNEFPFDGGRTAWHGSELPFFFHNAHKFPLYGGFPESANLERIMSSALINFVHNGNPNGGVVPHWEPYRTGEEKMMIFDKESRMIAQNDRELQKAVRSNVKGVVSSDTLLGNKKFTDTAAV